MKVLIKPNGDVVSVYNDRIPASKLGTSTITRASNVEYNHDAQRWEARLPDGTLIAYGPLRNEVIQDEIAYLEERLHTL
jgi:hypothetical protein